MSALTDAVAKHRAELLANERAAASRMVREYAGILQQIEREGMQLVDSAPDASGPEWLRGQGRLAEFRRQAQAQLDGFARALAGEVDGQQRAAVYAAEEHVDELTQMAVRTAGQANLPRVTFNRIDPGAILQAVGATSEGSPLARLLTTIAPDGAQGMADAIVRGVALGIDAPRVAKMLRTAGAVPLDRALVISRTEMMRAYRASSHESMRANREVITGWVWVAGLGPRCCVACVAMHGSVHGPDEDLNDHVCGRCTAAPTTIYSDAMQTGEEWLRGQDYGTQERILGPGRARMWEAGDASLRDFVGMHRSREWGETIAVRPLADVHP